MSPKQATRVLGVFFSFTERVNPRVPDTGRLVIEVRSPPTLTKSAWLTHIEVSNH